MARCLDCGREKREPVVTGNSAVDGLLYVAARVCLWCYDLNLLSGGFEPAGMKERWTADELVTLHRRAMDARATKQLHWRIRLQEKKRKKREAEAALGVMF